MNRSGLRVSVLGRCSLSVEGIFQEPIKSGLRRLVPLLVLSIILSGCTAFQASPNLYWGSVPTKEGVLALRKSGVKTIINFRTNSHKGRSKFVREQGLGFYNIHTGVFATPEEAELKRFLEIVCNPDNQPVYIACNIGIDRTAYYVAAYRIAVEGWTAADAIDEMHAHGLKMWWPTFRQYRDSLISNEDYMRRLGRDLNSTERLSRPAKLPCPCIRLADGASLLTHKHINDLPANADVDEHRIQ